MNETTEEENVKLTVTETETETAKASTNNTLSADDLIAITELIQEESSNTNLFKMQGIIIGSSLLGVGILCSLGTVISSHSSFDKYKNKNG